ERGDLPDELHMMSELEIAVDPVLDRAHPHFLEPADLWARELLSRDVRERRPAPEALRLGQRGRGRHGVARRPRLVGERNESFEPVRVQLVLGDVQNIAGRARREYLGAVDSVAG